MARHLIGLIEPHLSSDQRPNSPCWSWLPIIVDEGGEMVSDEMGAHLPENADDWAELFAQPEVENVEIIDRVLRVRLRSGVELEWHLDHLSRPRPGSS